MNNHKYKMHNQKERSVQCDQCGLRLHYESGLKSHTRLVHIKQIKQRNKIKKDFRGHNCEYSGTTRSNFNVHVLSKHKGIRFKCDDCEYSGTTRSNLKVHVLAKHKDVRFPCRACEYMYKGTTKRNTVVHMKNVHSM